MRRGSAAAAACGGTALALPAMAALGQTMRGPVEAEELACRKAFCLRLDRENAQEYW